MDIILQSVDFLRLAGFRRSPISETVLPAFCNASNVFELMMAAATKVRAYGWTGFRGCDRGNGPHDILENAGLFCGAETIETSIVEIRNTRIKGKAGR